MATPTCTDTAHNKVMALRGNPELSGCTAGSPLLSLERDAPQAGHITIDSIRHRIPPHLARAFFSVLQLLHRSFEIVIQSSRVPVECERWNATGGKCSAASSTAKTEAVVALSSRPPTTKNHHPHSSANAGHWPMYTKRCEYICMCIRAASLIDRLLHLRGSHRWWRPAAEAPGARAAASCRDARARIRCPLWST